MNHLEKNFRELRYVTIHNILSKLLGEVYGDDADLRLNKTDFRIDENDCFDSLTSHYEYVLYEIDKIVKLYQYLLEDSVKLYDGASIKQDKRLDKVIDLSFNYKNFEFKEGKIKDRKMDYLEYFLSRRRDSSFANSYVLNVLLSTVGVQNHIVRKKGSTPYYFNVVETDGNWYYFDLTQDIIDNVNNNNEEIELNHMYIGKSEENDYKDATIMPINADDYVQYGFYTTQNDLSNLSLPREFIENDKQKMLVRIYN